MGTPRMVDVRDMLCAQALAVVARTLGRLAPGEAIDVRSNADDVRHDLVVWATARGHPVSMTGAAMLRIEKRDAPADPDDERDQTT